MSHCRVDRREAAPSGLPGSGSTVPWSPSMDEGWTRWLVERFGFDFQNLYNADVLAGDLRDRYDVILVAARCAPTRSWKDSSSDRSPAGTSAESVRKASVSWTRSSEAGGTLVTLNAASDWAIDAFHLPVRNVVADVGRADFFMSGSIVEMEVDPSHPVMTGMPAAGQDGCGAEPGIHDRGRLRGHGVRALPGGRVATALGLSARRGAPAGVGLGSRGPSSGRGGSCFWPCGRSGEGQPFGNFRILFNALLYAEGVADRAPQGAPFWTAPTV